MNAHLALPLLVALLATTAVLAALLATRPSLTAARGGRILAFIAFVLLPAACLWAGLSQHLESSKTTEFCLSCHVMEPYGDSLWVDDEFALPANHFQNRRIDREHACFTCHTQYTMFGDFQAKIAGLKHLYIYYLGEMPETIELYQPYQNRECLHCHAGARSYEEMHIDDLTDLAANEMSCLDCHDVAHDVENLESAERWQSETDAMKMEAPL